MFVQNIAVESYKYFSKLEGNQYIASEFALKKIIEITENYKIKNVLELGLGIGSISYSILQFSREKNNKVSYTGTESDEFCLRVLPIYLKDYFKKIQIFGGLDDVPNNQKFDLVIIDGKEDDLVKIREIISNRGIVIIEGDRIPQLELIRDSFPNSLYTRLISNYKCPEYGPYSSNNWCGGIQLVFINPNLYQKVNFLYYKIVTAIRYRRRSIKK